MEDLSGSHIKGYDLQERIGSGGFGAVYKAHQSTVGREVAIKIILPGFANQPDFIRRFETEAQLVARLEHPFITPLYDYWRDPGGAYLVMRWLKGGSLRDALSQEAFELQAAGQLMTQITSALAAAHRNQVIHRDLKPANILLDEDSNAYLADFGIAKNLALRGDETDPDEFRGTPDYISPEQARSEPVTPQTDIYSLGVVLYELLSGQHPFPNMSSIERLIKHINDPLPLIENLDVQGLDAINTVIQRATQKNPAHRYADVLEFAAAFRQAIEASSIQVEGDIVEQLTQREQEILQLLITGMSNQDIATKLFITLTTVRWYLRQIYRKLGVRSRVQAIVRARELDLIVGKTATGITFEGQTMVADLLPEPENPYMGLRAFRSADNAVFFGREKLTRKLLKHLGEKGEMTRFLAVVGASGSGKSSVVKAGLIPAIWRGEMPGSERWFVVDMLPGSRPLDELEVALIRVAANQGANLGDQLRRDANGLLRVAQLILPDDDSELLLVIDQFEEVFTLVENETDRKHFLDMLYATVTDKRSRVRVVITLRADFYDRPLQHPGLGELMQNHTVTVLPLSTEELERAIRLPAEKQGVSFEEGLIPQIIGEVNYQAGALPLLQYALTELFERREGRRLTHAAYQDIGGTVGALAKRAEDIYQEMTPAAQEITRQMFLRLVTLGEGVEDTRRRTLRSELTALTEDADLLGEIIDTYAEYRLLSLDNDPATRTPTVEVAHEAILREWERLRNWLNESRSEIRLQRQLAHTAEEWRDAGQDSSFLLRGSRLEMFEKWAAETQLALTQRERDFLAASITRRDQEQKAEQERHVREATLEKRSRNFLRGLVAVLTVATIVAIGLSIFAFDQRQTAEDNAESAENHAAEAQQIALVAGSQAALGKNDTDTALALAWEAVALNPDAALAQAQLSEAAYSPGTIRRFVGHAAGVFGAVLSPDEKMILSGSMDKTLILWDIETGEIVRRFEGHRDGIMAVAFSPDGQTAVSGSLDKTAILWDVQTGEIIHRFNDFDNQIYAIAFSPDGQSIIAAGGNDTFVIQWDVQTGQVIRRFEGHTSKIRGIKFTPDGSAVLSGSDDETLILWDVQTGEIIRQFGIGDEDKIGPVVSIDISADGLYALSGDLGSEMVLWDLSSGVLLRRFPHTSTADSVAFSPDGRQALSSQGSSASLLLWDLQTGTQLAALTGHTSNIEVIVFASDGRRAISGSSDGVRLWDLDAGQVIRHFDAPPDQMFRTDRSPDGRLAVSTSAAGIARLWDVETGEEIYQFAFDKPVFTISFSPDGSLLLIGTGTDGRVNIDRGQVMLWDVETQQEIYRLSAHPHTVFGVEFSPDGRTAVAAGSRGTLILWDVATGQEIRRFHGYENDRFPPDGAFWDVAFSPDGRTILSAFHDGRLILWDTETGEEIRQFTGHSSGAEGVVFSRDGQTALSGAWDSTAILWDVQTGEIIRRYEHHTGAFFKARFTPDGRFILGGSGDGTTTLWNVETGEVIRRYTSMGVADPAVSADGRTAFVNGYNGSSRELWRIDLTLDELLAWTRANRYIRDLTCDERDLYRLGTEGCSEQ